MNVHEFHAWASASSLTVSAIRGLSTGDLLTASWPSCRPARRGGVARGAAHRHRRAPNVGKSSLVNRLLGQSRVIVSEIPARRATSRTALRYHEQDIVLIDTAGIRRRGRIERGIEKYSVMRAIKAISRADVVLLLIDAVDGVTDQDAHVAGYILEQAKSVVVVVNKWDSSRRTRTRWPSTRRGCGAI